MLIFSKYFTPIQTQVPIRILSSNSKNNAVIIQPIKTMIDLGLPYNRLEPFLKEIDRIFLTHEHGDHVNLATLSRLLKLQPRIDIWLSQKLHDWILVKDVRQKMTGKTSYDFDTLFLNPNVKIWDKFELPHTIQEANCRVQVYTVNHGETTNLAYRIELPLLQTHLLYATDLDNIEDLPRTDKPYNVILLEANYDENLLEETIIKATNSNDRALLERAKKNKAHLSEQEAGQFVRENLTEGGIFIPLHNSTMFGTYQQPGEA